MEHKGKGKPPEPVTRIAAMKQRDAPVPLPPNPAEHITDWLFEIGPVMPAGMGSAAIGWQEIDAWCNRTGIDLDPWEARTIRRLSNAYAVQQYEARKSACRAPFDLAPKAISDTRSRVTDQFKALLGVFGKA